MRAITITLSLPRSGVGSGGVFARGMSWEYNTWYLAQGAHEADAMWYGSHVLFPSWAILLGSFAEKMDTL